MNVQTRVSLVIGTLVALVIGAFLVVNANKGDEAPSTGPAVDASKLVREDSHVLGEKGSTEVQLVEFLDFQCPSCGAMHPVLEDLREKYAGQVTFVLRQFPLEMHPNAKPAAYAVEAAANQGKLEEMSGAVFASQQQWSDLSNGDATTYFMNIAKELGLDLAQFERDVTAPDTLARVEQDLADGTALGVQGTPTLFVDGRMLQLSSYGDIEVALEEALSGDKGDNADA